MRLEGRTVLVTGGASGLGGATTDMVVAGGGHAVIVDINEQTGYAKAAQHGERVRFLRTDVTNEEDVKRAVDAAVREFGRLDGVVNAAGIAVAERVLPREGPQPLDHFARTIQINLVGTFNVIRLAAAAMALNEPLASGERGVIVNTASVAAFDGQIGQAAYSASKGGIVGDDPADRARVRAPGDPRDDDRSRHLRYAAARGPARKRHGSRSRSRCRFPRGSAGPRSTPRWCVTSSKTKCSTAKSSGSTARSGMAPK